MCSATKRASQIGSSIGCAKAQPEQMQRKKARHGISFMDKTIVASKPAADPANGTIHVSRPDAPGKVRNHPATRRLGCCPKNRPDHTRLLHALSCALITARQSLLGPIETRRPRGRLWLR